MSLLALPLSASIPPLTPATLPPLTVVHIWQPLKKKVKGNRGVREGERGGHLAACALTSTRLAGVINRWLPLGGEEGGVTGCGKKGEIKT